MRDSAGTVAAGRDYPLVFPGLAVRTRIRDGVIVEPRTLHHPSHIGSVHIIYITNVCRFSVKFSIQNGYGDYVKVLITKKLLHPGQTLVTSLFLTPKLNKDVPGDLLIDFYRPEEKDKAEQVRLDVLFTARKARDCQQPKESKKASSKGSRYSSNKTRKGRKGRPSKDDDSRDHSTESP